MAAERREIVLHAEHNDELVRDELRAHVLCERERFRRVEAHEPCKREHDDAEDGLEREHRMNEAEQKIDEFRKCDERDDVRSDDQHQAASAEDGAAEEREERLALLAAIFQRGDRVLFRRNLDGV